MTKEIKNIPKLIILHLFPGLLLGIMYILFSKAGFFEGHPKVVTLGMATLVSNVPAELLYLLYKAKKEEGTFNIFKILGLNGRLKIKCFALYTLLLTLVGGILLIILKPLSDLLLKTVFGWIPGWYNFVQDMSAFPKNEILLATLVSFFIFTLLVSVIEELYFRGFLLVRMDWVGKYGIVFHVLLYSAYHFYQPWMLVTRAVAMLPVFYFVKKKNSLKLGIVVHCLANFIDVAAYMTLLF